MQFSSRPCDRRHWFRHGLFERALPEKWQSRLWCRAQQRHAASRRRISRLLRWLLQHRWLRRSHHARRRQRGLRHRRTILSLVRAGVCPPRVRSHPQARRLDGYRLERSAHGGGVFRARVRKYSRALRHRLQKRKGFLSRGGAHWWFLELLFAARPAESPDPRLGLAARPPSQQFFLPHRRPSELRAHDGGASQTLRRLPARRSSAHGLLHPHLFRPPDMTPHPTALSSKSVTLSVLPSSPCSLCSHLCVLCVKSVSLSPDCCQLSTVDCRLPR